MPSERHVQRNKLIRRLYAQNNTYSEIADELSITRNVVAGVVWRLNNAPRTRICSPGSKSANKIGTRLGAA